MCSILTQRFHPPRFSPALLCPYYCYQQTDEEIDILAAQRLKSYLLRATYRHGLPSQFEIIDKILSQQFDILTILATMHKQNSQGHTVSDNQAVTIF